MSGSRYEKIVRLLLDARMRDSQAAEMRREAGRLIAKLPEGSIWGIANQTGYTPETLQLLAGVDVFTRPSRPGVGSVSLGSVENNSHLKTNAMESECQA